ncbi:MAG: hypothetical protein U1E56_08335 [Bauldia sp.]
MSSIDEDLAELTRRLGNKIAGDLCLRVIADLKQEVGGLSGDDRGLPTVWAEIVDQVQNEESVFWGLYLDHISGTAERIVSELTPIERAAGALGSEGMLDWLVRHDSPLPELDDGHYAQMLIDEVQQRVLYTAGEANDDDDEEEDEAR